MINEEDRDDILKALQMKKHFDSRLSMVKHYTEKTATVVLKAQNHYNEYKKVKSMLVSALEIAQTLQ